MLRIYHWLIIYSVYKLLSYGDEQAAYQAHQTANASGYEKFYEPEGYTQQGQESYGDGEYTNGNEHPNESGYQTTEFHGA